MIFRFGIGLLFTVCVGRGATATHFTGEVSSGMEFRQSVGGNLTFVLAPTETGWMIRVAPKTACGGSGDFAAVVNAPYRNYNSLYVDASYGITAAQAVKEMDPRSFAFVLSCASYKIESNRLKAVLWPNNHSEKEQELAQAKLGSSPQGKGQLTILDSKVSPAGGGADDFGRIDWIRFRLDVTIPSASDRLTPGQRRATRDNRK